MRNAFSSSKAGPFGGPRGRTKAYRTLYTRIDGVADTQDVAKDGFRDRCNRRVLKVDFIAFVTGLFLRSFGERAGYRWVSLRWGCGALPGPQRRRAAIAIIARSARSPVGSSVRQILFLSCRWA